MCRRPAAGSSGTWIGIGAARRRIYPKVHGSMLKRMLRLRVHRSMERNADHTRDARKRELLDQFEHWLLPASIVLLGLALAFLWYVNSEWRESRRASPQVQVAPMTDLPSPPLPTPKR